MNSFVIILSALVSITCSSPLSGRIIGGNDAIEGQFPYQISLQLDSSHMCGGSILNNRWILTATHCVYSFPADTLSVVVGITQLTDPNAQVYQVERIIKHENYSTETLQNDIALLRVSKDIEFSDIVQPIQLNTEEIGAGVDLILSGWGLTKYPGEVPPDTMKWIQLTSINRDVCQRYHFWHHDVFETQICTLTRRGEGFCKGDSGGPLVLNGKQVGIVNWTFLCGFGFPDVFANVASYIDWINAHIN